MLLLLVVNSSIAQVTIQNPVLLEFGNMFTNAIRNDSGLYLYTYKSDYESVKFLMNHKDHTVRGPFTSYWRNGFVRIEAETGYNKSVRNTKQFGQGYYGYYHGKYKEYYETSVLKLEENYDGSRRNGESKLYNESGVLIRKGYYFFGRKDSIWTEYYSNGNLKSFKIFDLRYCNYSVSMWPNGNLKELFTLYPKSKTKKWDKTGKLTYLYARDSAKFYYNDDSSWVTLHYDSVKKNWLESHFRPNGVLKMEDRLDAFNGSTLGKQYMYDEKGKFIKERESVILWDKEEIFHDVERLERFVSVNIDATPIRGYAELSKVINSEIGKKKIKKKYKKTYKIKVKVSSYSGLPKVRFDTDVAWWKSEVGNKILVTIMKYKWNIMKMSHQKMNATFSLDVKVE